MKFFLIGFMGAGKSTIGKYASRHNGLTFLDLDAYIVEQQGKEISAIFEEHGEAHFREVERKALEEVIDLPGDYLVSCGGGTPCFYNNMEWMNAKGITVFIDPAEEILVARLDRKSVV